MTLIYEWGDSDYGNDITYDYDVMISTKDIQDYFNSIYLKKENSEYKKGFFDFLKMLSEYQFTDYELGEYLEKDDYFIDFMKKKYEKKALEEYEEMTNGGDPDGFLNENSYYRWKNGC